VQNEYQYAADATVKSTQSGSASYDANGMFNAPLIDDRLAARGVVFYRDESGFIDNFKATDTGTKRIRDINGEESWGARLAATWLPTDNLSITPSVFHQETTVNGSGTWDGAFRDLSAFNQRTRDRQETGFTLTGLEANWTLGDFRLVSATSYFKTDFDTVEDISKGYYHYGLIEADQVQLSLVKTHATRFSEEVRLSYTGARWNGVIGAFYLDEDRDFDQHYPRADGSSDPEIFAGTQANGEQQLAFFTEASLKLTDPLELTGGVRWFKGDQQQHVRFYSDGVLDAQDGDASESAVSPKVQLSYHFDRDKMAYASATKGFRPGGATGVIPVSSCAEDLAALGLTAAPTEFKSDRLMSYEVGTKLAFADNRAVIDTAVYYIDWKDVQQTVLLAGCGFTFLGNVGAARSRGFEVEASFKPTDHLSLSGSVGSTDAQFTKSNPDIGILEGDRLPLVPRLTVSASAQYAFTLPTGHATYVLADYQYQDKVLNGYASHYQRSYSTVNTRMGVTLSKSTELTLFVENLTNARPQLFFYSYDDEGLLPPEQRQDIISGRPRTYGVTFRFRH
jgi:outer membrane receptor protein involved in Fe transport